MHTERDAPMLPTKITYGDGEFVINGQTGEVLERWGDAEIAPEVVRFDIEEYRNWCAKEGVKLEDIVDIRLIGHWNADRTYCLASEDFREGFAEGVHYGKKAVDI